MSACMLQTDFCKQVRKILLENLKATCEEVHLQQSFFKVLTFSQVLLKDFAEIFQNSY